MLRGSGHIKTALVTSIIIVACVTLVLTGPVSATNNLDETRAIGGHGDAVHQSDSTEFIVFTIADSSVVQGDTFELEIEVTNEGDAAGTQTITYEVGSIYRENEMYLEPGETDTWFLTVDSDPLSPGEYTHYIESPSSTDDLPFLVKAGEPNFIVGNLRIEKDGEVTSRIEKGESAKIMYAILNDGEGLGTQYANCYLANENVGGEFLELEASEIRDEMSCTIDTGDLSPGTYEYGVETDDDSWYKEVVIEKPPQPPTIDSAFPSGNVRLNVATDDSEEFSVDASDPDSSPGALSTEWLIDGESYGTADRLTVYADDLSPGTHTLKAVVNDNQAETEAATREWTIDVVTPPRIAEQTPESESVDIEPEQSTSFRVTVEDGDTPNSDLDISWRVDGDQVGTGASFDLDRSILTPGTHSLSVRVSDDSDLTEDTFTEWTVRALARPSISEITPDRSTVTPGESVTFSVDPTDPNGRGITDVQWQIAGNEFTGRSIQHTFAQVGTVEAVVEVTNEAGLVATESTEITVESTPPRLESAGPEQPVVAVGEPVEFDVEASDPKGRSLSFDYQWRSDTGETDDQQSTTMRFDEVGKHEVTLAVTNKYGAETTQTYTVSVQNDEPSIVRRNPSEDSESILSQRTARFAAVITNRDSSPATVRFQIDGDTVETQRMTGDEELVSFQQAFSTPGERTVEISVVDSHGAENQVTWDIEVESRPPEIRDVSPGEGSLTVMSGETRSFDISAVDPEKQGVEYQWYRNSSIIGAGPSVTETFDEGGTYDLTVEASDPQGSTSTRSWSVNVRSFREPPTESTHLSNIQIDPESERVTKTFLTTSLENPSSNDRTVVVEFIIDTPDGLEVVRQRGVSEANNAQITGIGRIEPGSQRSMRVGLRIADESIIGSDVPIDVTIRYYPASQPEDLSYVRQSNEEVTIRRPGIIPQVTTWIDSLIDEIF